MTRTRTAHRHYIAQLRIDVRCYSGRPHRFRQVGPCQRGGDPLNIIDKTPAMTASAAADLGSYRLRRYIESLPADEIETRSEPVELGEIAEALEGNPRAVLFRAVGSERAELAANVTGSRGRSARAS